MLPIKFVQLDIPTMSEQQWHDLLNARTEFISESVPDDPLPSHEVQRQSLSTIPELMDHVIFWLFYDPDARCVGYCAINHPKIESPDYDARKERIYVEPVVLSRYRRQGVGTQLLPVIVDYARQVGAAWVQWDTKFESGFRFSEKIGAIEAGRQRTNRLAVDQVNWALMRQWRDEGQSRNPDVELIYFEHLPSPELIDPFCDLITELNRLQPSDDVEGMDYTLMPAEFMKETQRLKDQGKTRAVVCTREPDHTLSGMTDMVLDAANPIHASIFQTGVRQNYQGRGLGKWLKAVMMFDIHDRYPDIEFVDTVNFNSNAPMMSINNRMGFKLFEQFVFYKIRVQDLAAQADSTSR